MLPKPLKQDIEFLVATQQPNGSFLSYTSPDLDDFTNATPCHSVFTTALILLSLTQLEATASLRQIKQQAAGFLLTQASDHWTFNYWDRSSKQAQAMPYPDDLDDTVCALAALTQHDPALIDGAVLAKLASVLSTLETKEGGPYHTWLVPEDADPVWRDVDLAVNANIAHLLRLHDVELPNLTASIERALADKTVRSPYYPSPYSILYFISRAYQGPKTTLIAEMLRKQQDAAGTWGNPLNTALAMLTLLNLDAPPASLKPAVSYLMQTQHNGAWPPHAFYTGIKPKKTERTYYAGASALTTALCLEALVRYHLSTQDRLGTTTADDVADRRVYDAVLERVGNRFDRLLDDLRITARDTLHRLLGSGKNDDIVLLPYKFREALGKRGKGVDDALIVQLGLANLYGWLAYTSYDDILDGEGTVSGLPVANVCLRDLATAFDRLLPKRTGFPTFARSVLDTIDAANAWEATACRLPPDGVLDTLPDYAEAGTLADRSLGHALGPAAVLFALGYDAASPEVRHLMDFVRHYLAGRQLNDDMHDWVADLKRGQINAAGAMVLARLRRDNTDAVFNVDTDMQRLQELFWHEVVTEACERVRRHVGMARQAIDKLRMLADSNILETLLRPVAETAELTLNERAETLKFLRAYAGPDEISTAGVDKSV